MSWEEQYPEVQHRTLRIHLQCATALESEPLLSERPRVSWKFVVIVAIFPALMVLGALSG